MTYWRGVYVALVLGAAGVVIGGCAAEVQTDEGLHENTSDVSEAHTIDFHHTDTLYVADTGDDSVKKFNARTGAFAGTLVKSGSGGLLGPRGMIFGRGGDLLVANQNVETDFFGEILTFRRKSKAFLGALVTRTNPNAPFAPRGLAAKNRRLYVADMGDPDYVLAGGPAPNPKPARVAVFDESSGDWMGDIAYSGFDERCTNGTCTQWSPRAVVFGPDRSLYVSLMNFTNGQNPNAAPGRVLRITDYGLARVFVDGETCGCGLARPEGLTFGPDRKLYVTSFRKDEYETDKILVFDGKTGAYEDKIELAPGGQVRAFAQAIAVGPKDKLYVPISGNGPDTGSVRRYDVKTKTYDVLVAAGGKLMAPWYLLFGKTDSATLEYDD